MSGKPETDIILQELNISLAAIRLGIEILIHRDNTGMIDKELIALKGLIADATALAHAVNGDGPTVEIPVASGGTAARRIRKEPPDLRVVSAPPYQR